MAHLAWMTSISLQAYQSARIPYRQHKADMASNDDQVHMLTKTLNLLVSIASVDGLAEAAVRFKQRNMATDQIAYL